MNFAEMEIRQNIATQLQLRRDIIAKLSDRAAPRLARSHKINKNKLKAPKFIVDLI